MEAIKTGARGLDDITNYVEAITITNLTTPKKSAVFNNTAATPLRPNDVIALLSTPKYDLSNDETNRVFARVKAITGPAAEKGNLTNEFSFRYEMQVEIVRSPPYPLQFVNAHAGANPSLSFYYSAMANNLHDVRLIFRWPVVQRGSGWFVGNNRKSFRARIAGSYVNETNLSANVAQVAKSALRRNQLIVLSPNHFDVPIPGQ